jgi:hypothetical protein
MGRGSTQGKLKSICAANEVALNKIETRLGLIRFVLALFMLTLICMLPQLANRVGAEVRTPSSIKRENETSN